MWTSEFEWVICDRVCVLPRVVEGRDRVKRVPGRDPRCVDGVAKERRALASCTEVRRFNRMKCRYHSRCSAVGQRARCRQFPLRRLRLHLKFYEHRARKLENRQPFPTRDWLRCSAESETERLTCDNWIVWGPLLFVLNRVTKWDESAEKWNWTYFGLVSISAQFCCKTVTWLLRLDSRLLPYTVSCPLSYD